MASIQPRRQTGTTLPPNILPQELKERLSHAPINVVASAALAVRLLKMGNSKMALESKAKARAALIHSTPTNGRPSPT